MVHEAVEKGHIGIVLERCAQLMRGDVDRRTKSGITPAHVAAAKGNARRGAGCFAPVRVEGAKGVRGEQVTALVALKALGADLTVLAADRTKRRELETVLQMERTRRRELESQLGQRDGMDRRALLAAHKHITEHLNIEAPEQPGPRTCPICYDAMEPCTDQAPVCLAPCGHVFCRKCAREWYRRHMPEERRCPSCRAPCESLVQPLYP